MAFLPYQQSLKKTSEGIPWLTVINRKTALK